MATLTSLLIAIFGAAGGLLLFAAAVGWWLRRGRIEARRRKASAGAF